jgi:hypothetical protein
MPTPTAGPLSTAIDGLRQLKIAPMKPAPDRRASLARAPAPNTLPPLPAVSKALEPADMSAPAQKPRPAPVTTTTRTASSSSARINASSSSAPICAV